MSEFKAHLENLSPVIKKVKVEVPATDVDAELDKAYRGLSRTVKLKGYRPGKVPRRLLEKYFASEVEGDVAKRLVAATLTDAIKQVGEGLAPVAPPVVENPKAAQGQEFRYTARIEVKPPITIREFEGLALERDAAHASPEDVERDLEKLRQGFAQLVPVEGRDTAEEGDLANIDYEGFVDGKPIRGAKQEGALVQVREGNFLEGDAGALKGQRIGETRDVQVGFPADHPVPDLRGKVGTFKVALKALKRRELPGLDDELAKDLGQASLQALRERVAADLAKAEAQRVESELREQALKQLIEKNPLEAPPALVERATDALLAGAAAGFQRQGLDIRKSGLDLEKLREDLRERALVEVKGQLLLEAIAEQHGLTAGDEDVEAHIQKTVAELGAPVEKIRARYKAPEARAGLLGRLRQDKALALVQSRAKIADKA